jgi:hypothetical protein
MTSPKKLLVAPAYRLTGSEPLGSSCLEMTQSKDGPIANVSLELLPSGVDEVSAWKQPSAWPQPVPA